ncbi:hypothetical protein HRED_06325 [Candidatus Haloredivivus sp. G17]|nr:hypothetical protein HRED_06325 [Candidatus Haloredivivus sp. G17]
MANRKGRPRNFNFQQLNSGKYFREKVLTQLSVAPSGEEYLVQRVGTVVDRFVNDDETYGL